MQPYFLISALTRSLPKQIHFVACGFADGILKNEGQNTKPLMYSVPLQANVHLPG